MITRILHIAFVLVLMTCNSAWSQRPVITSIDRYTAGHDQVVTIKGNSFGTNAANLGVFFGSVRGTIQFVSDQIIEAKVPAGTTYNKISVTHLTSGLTGYSQENFLLSFGGTPGITTNTLESPQKNFFAERGLYDHCSCDFDGDGKPDFAAANQDAQSISLMRNTTTTNTLAAINLAKTAITINASTLQIACGDLNGDGKADIVATEAGSTGDRVFFLQNTSTGVGSFTFGPANFVRISGRKVNQVKIADFDGNGKPDIVVSAQNTNTLSVLVNTSTIASILFSSTPVNITLAAFANGNTGPVAVHDLNGDGLPEILTARYLQPTNIQLLRNTSVPGSITFAAPTAINFSESITSIIAGDLDGDQKPEVIATRFLSSGIAVFRNLSTSGSISFTPTATLIATEERPWGIDLGDLDGDAKADIVISSIAKTSLAILNNNSTSGNLQFNLVSEPVEFVTRNPIIVDVDGDARPDVTFTSIDENNTGVLASNVSILRNTTCLQPVVTSTVAPPINICTGTPFRLTASSSPGTTYAWLNNGTEVKRNTEPFLDITASGNYTVVAITPGCSKPSSPPVAVTVGPGTLSADPVLPSQDPLCVGSTLQLQLAPDGGGTSFQWTGPNSFSATSAVASVPNFQLANAGRYEVKIFAGTCLARTLSTVVEAIALPTFSINSGTATIICTGSQQLSIEPNPLNFSYQWVRDGVDVPGATQSTFSATTSGNYSVKAQYTPNPSCASQTVGPVPISFTTPIIADFLAPSDFECTGKEIIFANQSTINSTIPNVYRWDFGNGQTSSEKNGKITYTSAGNFSVKLTASYANGACENFISKQVTIRSKPIVAIANAGTNPSDFQICPEESAILKVTENFPSYEWSTGATTPTITVSAPGIYSVKVLGTNGCFGDDIAEIIRVEAVDIVVTATPSFINEGETSQLIVEGLTTFTWEPAESLNNATIANPVASPVQTTRYKVFGIDTKGCSAKDSVDVEVNEGSIYPKLTPISFLSPNGDEIGEFWTVERIQDFPGCEVTIYNDKGAQVFRARNYQNDWNGTFNGKPLPDGVYYFIIKCDGDSGKPRAGSITLLR